MHLWVGAVIEDGDRAVLLAAGAVLEGGLGTRTHLEVALEVPGGPVLTEPHEPAEIVDYHRAVLPGSLLHSDEDVSGGGVVMRLGRHLDGGRAKVRARAKGPHALRRHG